LTDANRTVRFAKSIVSEEQMLQDNRDEIVAVAASLVCHERLLDHPEGYETSQFGRAGEVLATEQRAAVYEAGCRAVGVRVSLMTGRVYPRCFALTARTWKGGSDGGAR
jgi:hypothetical protein